MATIPALGSTKDSNFLARVKETLEILTGRRGDNTVSLVKANGTTVPEYSLVDLCRFLSGETTKIVAHTSAAQTVAPGAWTQVELDTAEHDKLSEFDKDSHLATIQYEGWYWVSGQVQYDNSEADEEYRMAIWVNSTVVAYGADASSGAGQDIIVNTGPRLVYLYQNDTVSMYARPYSTGSADLLASSARTFLCISRQI